MMIVTIGNIYPIVIIQQAMLTPLATFFRYWQNRNNSKTKQPNYFWY